LGPAHVAPDLSGPIIREEEGVCAMRPSPTAPGCNDEGEPSTDARH